MIDSSVGVGIGWAGLGRFEGRAGVARQSRGLGRAVLWPRQNRRKH